MISSGSSGLLLTSAGNLNQDIYVVEITLLFFSSCYNFPLCTSSFQIVFPLIIGFSTCKLFLAIISEEPHHNKTHSSLHFHTYHICKVYHNVSFYSRFSRFSRCLAPARHYKCSSLCLFHPFIPFFISKTPIWGDANNCWPSVVFMVLKTVKGWKKTIWICHCELWGKHRAVGFRSTFTCPRQQHSHAHSISCRLNGPAHKNKLNGDI